ncbi:MULTISPECIES: sugar ABC transporter substrate-binding protein [unclassified Pseudomonas]|jgi:inositol transport system substrate-binding protein|uniref:sugar ABC transporter substrate-binding protein n=1 Tax=unclassified Pseudomonas TaxID=196821 RepID=UPI000F55BCA8|nr:MULTISPECIES: sugar ABC transporter substrate-binding protein [unclassified Pseudomonas]AZF05198.1 Inositol transport system sugar-binding protein [Pseudomonas sp. R5-89-07]AZF21363.1 Inositol transport system sugar-binding protein [Pseudomonas sp. R3-52-08]AZF26698.1 Inositol transport system sugar-binding protein [Pseudomonas sp. R2-60-08W]AZF32048.1 Inositol transport system sugar-binding protein [Pseudomonas sp. R4-35-07]AZF47715.1 Inositol transport system sugar-binding protein [Pseudo
MKTPIRFTALALSMLLASGVATAADIKVGVSMSAFDDTFLTYLREDMDKQAKSYPKGDGVQLQFEDARADVVKQLSQVENFISQKVDAIIVNPVDTASTANIIKAATAAKIPLVFVNRRPDQKDLPKDVVAVTSDDVEAGKLQMQYIAEKLGGKGKIVILLGDLANNSTTNRTKGVKEVLANYPGIKIEQEQTGTWLRDRGMTLVNDWLTQGREFNAVLANNDEMAIGASMALKSAGTKPGTVLIAGVDGTPDGLNAITKGEMAASAFQDAKGQAVGSVEAARKMARNEPVEQNVVIPFKLITPDNVKDFK